MHLISIKLCIYVETKRIFSESKHSPSDKETFRKKKTLKFPKEIP